VEIIVPEIPQELVSETTPATPVEIIALQHQPYAPQPQYNVPEIPQELGLVGCAAKCAKLFKENPHHTSHYCNKAASGEDCGQCTECQNIVPQPKAPAPAPEPAAVPEIPQQLVGQGKCSCGFGKPIFQKICSAGETKCLNCANAIKTHYLKNQRCVAKVAEGSSCTAHQECLVYDTETTPTPCKDMPNGKMCC